MKSVEIWLKNNPFLSGKKHLVPKESLGALQNFLFQRKTKHMN